MARKLVAASQDVITFDDGIKCVQTTLPSGKIVQMRELDFDDLRTLQEINGGKYATMSSDMPLISIVSLNGEVLVPVRNVDHLRARAKKFSATEGIRLIRKFDDHFDENLSDPKSETP